MNIRNQILVYCSFTLLLIASCQKKQKARDLNTSVNDTVNVSKYIDLIISMDTLAPAAYKQAVYREYALLDKQKNHHTNPFYHYFKAKKYLQEKHLDSALNEYKSFKSLSKDPNIDLLETHYMLSTSIEQGGTVDAGTMKQILAGAEKSEQIRSKLSYQFYDLLARAYYQNDSHKTSLQYAKRYYDNHPYRTKPVVQQRYYDISFLLSARMKDFNKMLLYNDKARALAIQNQDSMAFARTYDNEAQIYVGKKQFGKALASSRFYINYLKKHNKLNDIAYNNLASSFVYNNQLDSAIYYYQQAIFQARKNPSGKQHPVYYRGLVNVYKMKGAYASAMAIADAAYAIELRGIREIEAVKIADIQERYETEKKDRNIAALRKQNELNEKVITQQRLTIGLAVLVFLIMILFFYIIHRQYRLKEKNKFLQLENKRLNIEQKLLQAQLNPHFIFNSIANLQSLIATGDTRESVRYLSAFASLLRDILEQNRKEFISVDEEIISLENYLQLQQMRYVDLFDYQINVDDSVSREDTLVPPMLLQPFVENAIEHGFRNIGYKGLLTLSFKIEHKQLLITVDDNGKGFTEKAPNQQKKQSLAGIILKERLEALFKSGGKEAGFEIVNKKDKGQQGVAVQIVLPEIKD
jgi:two-component sensor histidine kinase